MSVKVITFGCRLNIHESEVIRKSASEAGLQDSIVINTCAVTNEAVRQARQAVRRARRENPEKRIIVTGCAAQTGAEEFANMDEVDLVIGNEEKMSAGAYRGLPAFGVPLNNKIRVNDIFSVRETAAHLIEGLEGHTRAFVQVQNGCDHRCTFCIIPFGRGNSRSVPMGAVVDQIRKLVENGYREVVLTGVDVTSYGSDLPGQPKLGSLVRKILQHIPELCRLRLSSIDSIEADDDLMIALKEEQRLMPHLHLSLQSGDDMILKRMKRRHLRADTIAFCEQVRDIRPDVIFGADIIAGFPTETDQMFENSLNIIDECGLTHLHIFPFSPRPGTPAEKMPQLERRLVKDRAARLRQKGNIVLEKFLANEVGSVRSILVEKNGLGRTEQFTQAELDSGKPGDIVRAKIVGSTHRHLQAAVV
ncbi:MAG: tRNA (N(6)-L-threonylcarbamoyladenosine(37)-C(2))-methylthiotransferase MtaB [Hyphomicrobiales bacterium]|nr:MAG: tRNA (N(6)-L-threonylcarbamoyladenosine(37)-C(2))-methylthiotransferase MtaB [Hyphomicrobiales bacterium]